MSTPISNSCWCSGRSFWEGPCDYCVANPIPSPTLTFDDFNGTVTVAINSAFDALVMKAAEELGWHAGLAVSGFLASEHFESGGGI